MKPQPSGLAAAERYALPSQILSDPSLSAWFLAICTNRPPPCEIDDTTLALLEAGGIVRRTERYGFVLAPEGRAFARDLGILPPPSRIEIDPASPSRSSPFSDEAVDQKWREYKTTADEALRNELLEHYVPLVKQTAEKIRTKLPEEVQIEDLSSAGIFGLIDAIESFDLARGVRFETFCQPRIRGAILDELRSMDWVPRLVRSRSTWLDQARKSLEMRLGRKLTEEELAERSKLTLDELREFVKDAGARPTISLSRKWFDIDSTSDISEIDVLEDTGQINPLTTVQRRDLKTLFTKGLSRAERVILILYYYEEMTMKEIAHSLDLSESRVSQMHSSILVRLCSQLTTKRAEIEG